MLSTQKDINSIIEASNSLITILDNLQDQTMQVALFGEVETTSKIKQLRQQMKEQDQNHLDGIAEIMLILKDCLETKLFEHLQLQAQQEIEHEIDQLVQEQVAICLKELIPQHLQDEFAEQRRELENFRMKLHNSESRRANATLRSNQPDSALQVIYMSNGGVSAHYPKSLQDLFDLDAERCKALMRDYELPDISDARDRNLNRFIQFCGVTYQMVRTGTNTRRVGMA